jgi:hypothetical protein
VGQGRSKKAAQDENCRKDTPSEGKRVAAMHWKNLRKKEQKNDKLTLKRALSHRVAI